MKEKSQKTDVYIKPNMDRYSVIDFELRDSIIQEGNMAALEVWESLRQVAARQGSRSLRLPVPGTLDSLQINRLILQGNSSYSRGYVKGKLRFDLSEKISFNKLRQGISNLSATGNFNTIRYTLN